MSIVVCCVLFDVRVLFVGCCLLAVLGRLLFVVVCSLLAVCCFFRFCSSVVCCVPVVVCRVLVGACWLIAVRL